MPVTSTLLTAGFLLQVLQLPAHLRTAVFREGIKLASCLTHLPPHLHAATMSAALPEITSEGALCINQLTPNWSHACTGNSWKDDRRSSASDSLLVSLLTVIVNFEHLCKLDLDLDRQEESPGTEAESDSLVPSIAAEIPGVFHSSLSRLTCLRSISISGTAFMNTEMLSAVASSIPGFLYLTTLKVIGRDLVSSPELMASVGQCTGLKTLYISSIDTYDEQSSCVRGQELVSIAKLQGLESLALTCRVVTGASLSVFAEHLRKSGLCMPSLQTLHLDHCNLGTKGANALWSLFKRLPKLQQLTLDETFSGVSVLDKAAALLANRLTLLTGLRSLDMGGNRIYDDADHDSAGLTSFVQEAAKLEALV